MIVILMLLAHVALCLLLAWGVIARAVMMSDETLPDVRLCFVILGGAALFGLAAPVATGFVPDAYSLLITAATCLVQSVTRRYWTHGVPDRFCKPGHAPRTRRATDMEAAP